MSIAVALRVTSEIALSSEARRLKDVLAWAQRVSVLQRWEIVILICGEMVNTNKCRTLLVLVNEATSNKT